MLKSLKPFLALCSLLFCGCVAAINPSSAAGTNQPAPGPVDADAEARQLTRNIVHQQFRNGMAYLNNGQYDQALDCFHTCLRLDSANASALNACGFVYAAKGDADAAQFYFSEAIRVQPGNASTYFNRGNLFRAKNDTDKAIADYSMCLRLDPKNAAAYKARAALYFNDGKYEKTEQDCTSELALAPNDEPAFMMSAESYYKLHKYESARTDYDKAISIAPASPGDYNDYAWLLATCPDPRIRNGAKAVQLATQACNLSSWTEWQYIDTIGVACAANNDFDKAIDYEQRVLYFTSLTDDDKKDVQSRIELFKKHQPYHE
jgi:tetratricopeptide (TPR) repeat protein